MTTAIDKPAGERPGRLGRALIQLIMRRARVVSCEPVADRFRLVTLQGAALAGAAWAPGRKIQVAMGSAFVARTYTPMDWDAVDGRTRILGYAHGEGPGSAWLRALRPGDECAVFGPRASLTIAPAAPLVVCGDETSMGLAHALAAHGRASSLACVFEVGDLGAARAAAARLELPEAALFERAADDAHVEAMAVRLASLAETGATFVLTGRAGAIQALRRSLLRRAVAPGRILAKAYWAPGKAGLD
ncbi:MAG: siderophore-interacting protein [Caulobacter sp.]